MLGGNPAAHSVLSHLAKTGIPHDLQSMGIVLPPHSLSLNG